MVQIQLASSASSHRRRKVVNHRLPPIGAVLLAIVILLVSCCLTLHRQHQKHRSHRSVDAPHAIHRPTIIRSAFRETFRSAKDPISWCQSPDCLHRLESLHAKLRLEEQIYQEQYQVEKARFQNKTYYRQYTREDIIQYRRDEILEDSSDNDNHFPPNPKWKGVAPELNVIGNLKTGTSQLYNIFATHKQVSAIEGDEKEHCPSDHYGEKGSDEDTFEYGLHSWHQHYFDHRVSGKRQVNGCISTADFARRVIYNPPSENAKFFILLRDPADWAWAAYNFWCDRSWEDYEKDDNWVDDSIHYRSPEVFHEVILSGGKLKAFELLRELREDSIKLLREAEALVGKENLIVLKNEDLVPRRIHESGLLERLVDTTGLSVEGFDEKVLKSRSNCNAKKGYEEKCSDADRSKKIQGIVGSGVGYPVTHNRPMLESTRKFIYLQWYKECVIWYEEFGIEYPECLSSIQHNNI